MHLTLLGKEGLREMAHQNLSKAQFALAELTKIPGVKRRFAAPFFNEFTIELPRSARIVNRKARVGGSTGVGATPAVGANSWRARETARLEGAIGNRKDNFQETR